MFDIDIKTRRGLSDNEYKKQIRKLVRKVDVNGKGFERDEMQPR